MDLLNQTSLKREEKIQLLTDGLPLSWRDVFAAAQPADPTKWIQVALSVEHNRPQSKLRNLFKPKVCTLSQQERSVSNCPFFCPICMKKIIKVKHWLNECPDYDPNYKTERSSKNTQPKQFIATVTESTTSNETNKVACLSTNNPPYKLIDFKICVNKHPLQAFMDTGATISLISQNLIKSLNLHPLIDFPMQIQQANSLTKTLGYVYVNLQIHNKTRKVKLHVIPNLKFQLLIGLDIAEDFELIVDTKDKTVYTKQSAEMALVCTTFNHLQKPNQDKSNKLLQLHGTKYFTTLDVAWGYWHVQMHPESVPKTGFVTNNGHYEFLVMPFGLKNAASTFQKIIQQVIGTLLWKGVCVFQDDIIIYSSSFSQHMNLIKQVFEKLLEYNIKLKFNKCSFAQSQVKYLGHIIGHNKVKPDPDEIKSVQDLPQPTTVKGIRRFIGLANFYRKFIPRFAEIATPLSNLTQKNKLFSWTPQVDKSFIELKAALTSEPILTTYNPEVPCKLYTDASAIGIAGILSQEIDSTEHVSEMYFILKDGIINPSQPHSPIQWTSLWPSPEPHRPNNPAYDLTRAPRSSSPVSGQPFSQPLKQQHAKCQLYLISSVGVEAQRQYYTLPKASTATSLSEAIDLLRQRYVVNSHPWVIRMKFNDRRQLQGETIADYISALRALAKDCAYGSMEDELIRDRFIVGTKIKQLRDRLLVETTDLNLDQVVQLASQYEKAQEDNKMFDKMPEGINKIAANDRRPEPNLRERKKISTNFKCLRCGGKPKATSPDCPAEDVKCHQCLKISPIVVSKKKDGSIRLCVDLREPNKAVILDAYPIPLIEDILSSLHGCKVFANLDLSLAHYQIRLHSDSRYLTTFITHMGIYQFKRLPDGLSSAPGAFQRYLSELLMDIKDVSCYLDDIIIGVSSMEDHDKKLNQVLSRLRDVNLMLNDAKSIYRQKSLKFLGHIIDDNGVHLDEELMKPLLDAPPPKDKSGLRSLIGMINLFQKYIHNTSTIMEPLQKLFKKSVPFKWRGEHAKALQTVKDSLKKEQVLALFCPKMPTVITTDASYSGIGCVVSQLSEKGEERIVACASRTLSDAERKYSIVEKEALACVWACEKNDRAGLRIVRWSARLMNFDYNIEYKKERDNVLPDYLSRLSLSSHEDYDGEVELIASINQDMLAISEEEFLRECSLCPEIIALKEQLAKPWSNNEYSRLNKYFRLRNDLSVQENLILNEKGKILVPVSLRNELLSFAHKAHQGIVRTKQRLRESYWWPGMNKDVEDLVTKWWVCKNHDKRIKSIRVPITPVERPANPWTKLGLDIVGPFIDTEIGFRFAITLIEYTSKWPEVFCTNKTTSKVIIKFLEDVFSREGFSREIVTDKGTPFISEEFEDFLGSNGIKHIRSTNYHPACNGEVENFNKTLKSTVLTAHLQHTEVKRTIQLFLREYRSTPHTVTKQTPSAVLHGRTLRTLVHVFDKDIETKPPKEACRQEDKRDSESKSCSPKLPVGDQRIHSRYENIAIVLRSKREATIEEIQQTLREEESRRNMRLNQSVENGHEQAYRIKDRKVNQFQPKICFVCNKKGHLANDCWFRDKQKQGYQKKWTPGYRNHKYSREHSNNLVDTIKSGFNEQAFETYVKELEDSLDRRNDRQIWSIDSGCTAHLTPNITLMENVIDYESEINLAEKGKTTQATAKGDMRLTTCTSEGQENIRIKDILHVPNLRNNF
ncbi:hypothetical protein LAZ67_23001089, partial [Cordylochernes scorpioides]